MDGCAGGWVAGAQLFVSKYFTRMFSLRRLMCAVFCADLPSILCASPDRPYRRASDGDPAAVELAGGGCSRQGCQADGGQRAAAVQPQPRGHGPLDVRARGTAHERGLREGTTRRQREAVAMEIVIICAKLSMAVTRDKLSPVSSSRMYNNCDVIDISVFQTTIQQDVLICYVR